MVNVIQLMTGGFDKNFSYLLTKNFSSKEAIIVDPTGELSIIEDELNKKGLTVVAQIFTHSHPDHTELKEYFESKGVKSFFPKNARLGEIEEIKLAGIEITVIHTPGHTKDSVCFLIEDNLFSGDTLFVRGVGTTAYGGNDLELKGTLRLLFTLNHSLKLWPGHNYGGASSTLGEALKNSHIAPSKETLEKIKNKVTEYEKQSGNHEKFTNWGN